MPQSSHWSRASDWKPVVVCPQPGLLKSLQTVFSALTVECPCTLTEYPRAGVLTRLIEGNGCNIVFVDVDCNTDLAQAIVSEISRVLPVVALHSRNDAELILRCLRCGASEFVTELSEDAVRGVLERMGRAHAPGSDELGTIYCVVPGKPGCGASTLAVHLAVQLRADGDSRVLLVDGDELTSSIAFMLKLKPEFHLQDVLRDWSRMDDDLWSRLTVAAFGLDILAAPEDPTSHCETSRAFASQLCEFWRKQYDVVVLDLPDVRTALDSGFAALADLVLMVTTGDLAALHACSRALRYINGAIEAGRLRLILNRYTPAGGLNCNDVKTALALPPFATLCNDPETIQASLLEGKPASAESRFAAGVRSLCRQLAPRPVAGKQAGSWLTSFLGSRGRQSK